MAPRAYVANGSTNNVSVIDTGSNTVVATVGVGRGPRGSAVTPDGLHAYVANITDSTVSVIDTGSNTVVATITVSTGPINIAFTPDGSKAYVTCAGANAVSVISTASLTVVATVSGTGFADFIAITPDGLHAYVGNYNAGPIYVISTVTNTVTTTISGYTSTPRGIAILGTTAYVVDQSVNAVVLFSTVTNLPTGVTIAVGHDPFGIAITPDGLHAYVGNYTDNTVSVISLATNTVVTTVSVGANPQYDPAITPDGAQVYVSHGGAATVDVIATASNTVTHTITAGTLPLGIGIVPPAAPAALTDWQFSVGSLVMGDSTDYDAVKYEGLDLPPIRSGDTGRPRDHGELAGLDLLAGREITVTLQIMGTGALQSSIDALGDALGPVDTFGTPAVTDVVFKIKVPNLPVLTANVRVRGMKMGVDLSYVLGMANAVVALHANDPRLYGPANYVGGALGSVLSATNAGNLSTPPVITIQGPCSGPSAAVFPTNDGLFRFGVSTYDTLDGPGVLAGPGRTEGVVAFSSSLSLGSSDVLVLDLGARTATVNGTENVLGLVLPGANWWMIPPGSWSVGASAASVSAGSTQIIEYSSAWGSI